MAHPLVGVFDALRQVEAQERLPQQLRGDQGGMPRGAQTGPRHRHRVAVVDAAGVERHPGVDGIVGTWTRLTHLGKMGHPGPSVRDLFGVSK